MRGPQLGSHTVRSHGMTVARSHKHDWLILIVLLAIVVILNSIRPFYRFVGKDMMIDLKYPLKSNTVPMWAVPVYAVLLPMIVFLLLYFRRRDVYDLHHATLGLLFSVLITAVITDAIKDAVGRPRPDFFWRCFPDGKELYDKWGDVVCHGDEDVIKEGHKSFPSGHTSCLVVAAFCYLQFFPPPYHARGWATYAYFRVLDESQGTAPVANGVNVNANNTHSAGVQVASQQNERNNNANTGISLSRSSVPTVEDLESGRR